MSKLSTPWSTVIRNVGGFGLGALALLVATLALLLVLSLPQREGIHRLPGLAGRVVVAFDQHAIPDINAQSRMDAYRALGYVTAQERLFQMDLLRRHTAGRWAEIFGDRAVAEDRWHRLMGFRQVAAEVWRMLPADQQAGLTAYAQGVNAGMKNLAAWPFEFLVLGYQPEPWVAEDSLLVMLGMYTPLTWRAETERSASVMQATLPPEVFEFFTPDTDHYADAVTPHAPARRPLLALPRASLAALLRAPAAALVPTSVQVADVVLGSNGWLLAPQRTAAGRALLANDMHLRLGVPNIWYRARLSYPKVTVAGTTLPGLPGVISGSNGRIAWGFTNIEGDFTDLVRLHTDAARPGQYRGTKNWTAFDHRQETIAVRGAAPEVLDIAMTEWGPVLPQPLLGQPVAVRWTALDPAATDLSLLALEQAGDLSTAMAVMNRAGMPPQTALIADRNGDIGWTFTGKLPRRRGFDGLVSRDWSVDLLGWDGYVPPAQLPRQINPSGGVIVAANQRMVGRDYPYVVGHAFASGYRAYRIAQLLNHSERLLSEAEMLRIQTDTEAEIYRYYQNLALQVLSQRGAEWSALQQLLASWDGRADPGSMGLAVLVEFRRMLAQQVLGPYFARCRQVDPAFQYHWNLFDEPLQQILDARAPELLPTDPLYANWDALLLALLHDAAQAATALWHGPAAHAAGATAWGQVNRVKIRHPLSTLLPPVLSTWLDMPNEPLSGCPLCVRVASPQIGASERFVVAPGHEARGLLQMPGGQSGHPLSAQYRDQQAYWVDGLPLPLANGTGRSKLVLWP